MVTDDVSMQETIVVGVHFRVQVCPSSSLINGRSITFVSLRYICVGNIGVEVKYGGLLEILIFSTY
jgi:hypothetical protein